MRRIWFLVVLLASAAAHGASFDCSKARTPVEKAICADPHLSSLDDQMAQAYRDALNKADEAYPALRQDQRAWLKGLNAGCSGAAIGACIEKRETERIQALGSGAATAAARAKMPPVPPVCPAVIAAMNKALPDAVRADAGTSVDPIPLPALDKDFKEPKPVPGVLARQAKEYEQNLVGTMSDSSVKVTVGDASVNGNQVKVVEFHPPFAGCSGNAVRYEFWTMDLKTMLGKFDGEMDDGNPILDTVPSWLLSFEGKTYLVVDNSVSTVDDSVTLKELQADWTLANVCHIGLERRRPEVVLTAADAELCDAAAGGQVETVPMQALKQPGDDGTEVLRAKATADLYNDGHPVTVGISNTTQSGPGHCDNPMEDREEHPVVLTARGAPIDASIQKDVQANEIRLIRFKGVTYVEGRSTEDVTLPPTQHDIWKMTHGGATKVCSMLPVRFAVK